MKTIQQLIDAGFDEDTIEEMFDFLDELRESGDTNMFGAGPYLVAQFGIGRSASYNVLGVWMETFEIRHPHEA